jgi:hypothetical protein
MVTTLYTELVLDVTQVRDDVTVVASFSALALALLTVPVHILHVYKISKHNKK